MRIKEIRFINRAPFENLTMRLDETNVVSLTGVNGSGKTTIISYIVDAFYEMARKIFENDFSGEKHGKYYRVTSSIYNTNLTENSLVYICFVHEGNDVHYIDYLGSDDENLYNEIAKDLAAIVPFSVIKDQLRRRNSVKYVSCGENIIKRIFENNLATYFPAYRYEQPGYLNDVYKVELEFNTDAIFSGYLPNPIEVSSNLPRIANWIMDVVLDSRLYNDNELKGIIDQFLSAMLVYKSGENVRLGIGKRHMGGARIQVVKESEHEEIIYPSIFNLSSGESAVLCIASEILKQTDRIGSSPEEVQGIVLIDEVDKHLHVFLQKIFVPELAKMFPNIQFIISTHSFFVNMGISDEMGNKCVFFDLDKKAVLCDADKNDVFREAYEMLVVENERYMDRYNEVLAEIQMMETPIVLTEGKTDWKHLRAAQKWLSLNDLGFDIYECEDTIGDVNLKAMLESFARLHNKRKIIGMFDRDSFDKIRIPDIETQEYVSFGNNVYAFAIPAINTDVYGTEQISIEHYYKKSDLTRMSSNGKRLFLGKEFNSAGIGNDCKYYTRFSGIENKVKINGVIDEKVYAIGKDPERDNDVALSKNQFAEMMLNDTLFASGVCFDGFTRIFEVIKDIISNSN